MFGILTPRDFFDKVKADAVALSADTGSASKGINAVLSAYHLHEWVWGGHLKNPSSPLRVRGVLVRTKGDWIDWLAVNCPHWDLLQELANGSKHFEAKAETARVAGWGSGPFGVGPFGSPYLLVDLGPDHPADKRYLVGHILIEEIVAFWEALFPELGIT